MVMDTMVAWSGLAALLVIDWKLACLASLTLWAWRFYYWAWVTPKRTEVVLREQGFDGNPFRFVLGDLKENTQLLKEAQSKPIGIDDDILPRVHPIVHKSIQKYGRKHFVWVGRMPRVTILDPEHVKEVLTNYNIFQKKFGEQNPLSSPWCSHAVILRNSMTRYESLDEISVLIPIFITEQTKHALE